jgi:hypothetical protein
MNLILQITRVCVQIILYRSPILQKYLSILNTGHQRQVQILKMIADLVYCIVVHVEKI